MKTALVFPGQGSQVVGMGKDLYDNFLVAKDVFHEVDEALHQKLSQLMFEGPLDELTLTRNTQPALMATSMAVMAILAKEGDVSVASLSAFCAGHSLGEYAALTATGAFTLADCARLLRIRGEAMQAAVPAGQGAMAALLGGTLEAAKALAQEAAKDELCVVANDNASEQQVISGHRGAVERAMAMAAEAGFKRAVLLPVSAPFHSPLMAPAAQVMAQALAEVSMAELSVPVVANMTAQPEANKDAFRTLLVEQVTGTVRWRETLLMLQETGVERVIEIGTGKVLSGLAKRTVPDVTTLALNTTDDITAFITSLA